MANDNKKTKPIAVYRSRGVSMSVFANPSDDDNSSRFYKVSIQKTYRDKDGEFKSTNTFGQDDLPHLATLAQSVWSMINDQESSDD